MNNQIAGVNLIIYFLFIFFFWGGGGEKVVEERVTALTAFSFIFLLRYIFI